VAKCDNQNVTRLLIKLGVDINAKDNDGCTALHVAATNSRDATIRMLMEYGDKTAAKDKSGRTIRDFVANSRYMSDVRREEVLGLLNAVVTIP
jgi:ankyrin repeat protein